jgi:hypothetical protein
MIEKNTAVKAVRVAVTAVKVAGMGIKAVDAMVKAAGATIKAIGMVAEIAIAEKKYKNSKLLNVIRNASLYVTQLRFFKQKNLLS